MSEQIVQVAEPDPAGVPVLGQLIEGGTGRVLAEGYTLTCSSEEE